MGSIFRVINYNGDIEVSEYKKANAIFQTNEYSELEEVCIHKEVINIFNLLKENQELEVRNKDYKSQQKEFIKYLEDEIERKRLNATCTTEYNDYVIPLRVILQKYKEIIGVSNGKES